MRILAKTVLAHPLLEQPFEIDLAAHELRFVVIAARLGDEPTVFVDQGLAIPREVGSRFARPSSGVKVRREASRRLIARQTMPVVRLPYRHIRGGQVQQYGRAGERSV